MDFNSGLLSLILMLNLPGFLTLDSVCKANNICALRENSVTLKCSYKNTDFKPVFWFSEKQSENWRKKEEPEDLSLDSSYAGRVNQRITDSGSELTIRDLRETDSGEYQLMFIMKDGVQRLSSVAVNLTVTVLQVKILQRMKLGVQLTCDTNCNLTPRPQHFYWKKDGQYIKDSRIIFVSFKEYAAYSCFLTKDLQNSSDPVCLSDRCWNVIYTSRRVCVLVGSTVDIPSTYSHPTGLTVEETFWHHMASEGFVDLREEQKFAGRVEYVGNTLRIKDVNMSDSGEYRFRISTNTPKGKYSGSPGVILTVTDTQVIRSNSVSEGKKVILSCLTKCTLDNKHTYIWYKNGQLVTDGFTLLNKLYLDSVSKEEIQEYSCAVGEIRSDEVPGPEKSMRTRNTTVILCVLLISVLIGVLWYSFYRRSKNKSSRNCENTKKDVQPDSSTVDKGAPLSTVCDFTHRKEQDIHYSSVNFKQSPKTSSSPTVIYSSVKDVHYATLKLK